MRELGVRPVVDATRPAVLPPQPADPVVLRSAEVKAAPPVVRVSPPRPPVVPAQATAQPALPPLKPQSAQPQPARSVASTNNAPAFAARPAPGRVVQTTVVVRSEARRPLDDLQATTRSSAASRFGLGQW